MGDAFPKATLVTALCISSFSLLAHAAGLVAYHKHDNPSHRMTRVSLRRQTLHHAIMFCSISSTLGFAEVLDSNTSLKRPLAWFFLSVVYLEADRRQLASSSEMSETSLTFSPLLSYIRPLPLMYAAAPSQYYSLFGFLPIIIEFAFTCCTKLNSQNKLHLIRCSTVAGVMTAFLVASLVAAFTKVRYSELILGLALDALLLLIVPLREAWIKVTVSWWREACFNVLQKWSLKQVPSSNNTSQSRENLQSTDIEETCLASRESVFADDAGLRQFDEEHSLGMAGRKKSESERSGFTRQSPKSSFD